jgi:hypothetical protein
MILLGVCAEQPFSRRIHEAKAFGVVEGEDGRVDGLDDLA